MLPSALRNLFWGAPAESEPDGVEVKHTAREEAGDWLVISCQNSCDGNSNSQCDLESVSSDGSWILTPAPTFKRSTPHQQEEVSHSLEDLLIEHPTMSVYRQNSTNEAETLTHEGEEAEMEEEDREGSEAADQDNEERNVNRELVLLQNRRRQQLATQLQIPLANDRRAPPRSSSSGSKPPKLTRRALKRHNPMSRQSGKHQVQKCSFKAGRRRC